MHHRYAFCLLTISVASLLGGCGFIAAPVAGTATSAAQLSMKGADQAIHYGKEAASIVVEAAGNVADAARSGLEPATSDEARALHEQFSDR